jgi:hypothetical protein
VKLNAERHGDVNLHTFTVRDADASSIWGMECDVVYGMGKKSLYVAFGKAPLEALKVALDKSSQAIDPKAPLLRLEFSLTPILKFAKSNLDHTFGLPLAIVEQSGGKDHVVVTFEGIENGARARIEAEEGVLPLVGPAVLLWAAWPQSRRPGFVEPPTPHGD